MLGVVGGETSMRASLIGDAVNLAARVEGLTKRYGARMLISENTAKRCFDQDSVTLRPLERVQVVGKTRPTMVYEVLEAMDPALQAKRRLSLATYMSAHNAYEAGDLQSARTGFAQVLAKAPDDEACMVMLKQVETVIASGEILELPPITKLENK